MEVTMLEEKSFTCRFVGNILEKSGNLIVAKFSNTCMYVLEIFRLLPEKLMREWYTLFTAGQPLYETVAAPAEDEAKVPAAEQLLEDERKLLLDEGDFNEYRVNIWIQKSK